MNVVALVFDFDGVILDSEGMKHDAFVSLFHAYPDAVNHIRQYNAEQRGVPRATKLRYICEQFLRLDDCHTAVERFLQEYAQVLAKQLEHAPLIPSVAHFLGASPHPKFVSSSAPQAEVEHLITTHNIAHHFARIYGYPSTKEAVLNVLKQEYRTVIFFGDAIADYEAAQGAGVHFVGVIDTMTSERFDGLGIPCIHQFENMPAIQSVIQKYTLEK